MARSPNAASSKRYRRPDPGNGNCAGRKCERRSDHKFRLTFHLGEDAGLVEGNPPVARSRRSARQAGERCHHTAWASKSSPCSRRRLKPAARMLPNIFYAHSRRSSARPAQGQRSGKPTCRSVRAWPGRKLGSTEHLESFHRAAPESHRCIEMILTFQAVESAQSSLQLRDAGLGGR
jgi:hypothetical protein